MQIFLLIIAAFLAGAINSVAGGGTLLTFPALLAAGLPPVVANATNTVALVPASISAFWGYRKEAQSNRTELLCLGIPSIIGGILGAIYLIKAGDALFSRLVPWLIFGATALFIIQEPIRHIMARRTAHLTEAENQPTRGRWVATVIFQFAVAFYGGFFGAGIGILMLASLGLLGLSNIHRMNALKNFAAICINGVATITFIYKHEIDWRFAIIMALASTVGGYLGAGAARRLGQKVVRGIVIFIGLSIGILMLVHPIHSTSPTPVDPKIPTDIDAPYFGRN